MDIMFIIKAILLFSLIPICLAIFYVLIEVGRTVAAVRRMMQRIELLTDIKGWLHLIRKLPKKVSK
jgi:hypothetical protein